MSFATRLAPLRRPLIPPASQVRFISRMRDRNPEARQLKAVNRPRDNAEKHLKRNSNEATLSDQNRIAMSQQIEKGLQPLFSKTFVSLPIQKYIGSQFFTYSWLRLKAWAQVFASNLFLKWQSSESTFGRAKWKMNKSRIPTIAQSMYRDLMEGFAAGDIAQVEKVSTPVFAEKYIKAIQKRKPNETMSFEMEFNKGWWYPRLMSYMVTQVHPTDPLLMGEQAVVAISSIQRLNKGNGIKEQKVLEYVVLRREFRKGTWLPVSPWRLWQTTKPTTLESWARSEEDFERRLLEQFSSEIGFKKAAEDKKTKA